MRSEIGWAVPRVVRGVGPPSLRTRLMTLRPRRSPLDPWSFTEEDFLPVEPPGGLRGGCVRLGTWRSPGGFPWDVCLVRLDWCSVDGDPWDEDERLSQAEDAPGKDALTRVEEAVPCLLLVPRSWPVPREGLREAFEEWWRSAEKRLTPPLWAPSEGSVRWRRSEAAPTNAGDLWRQTLDVADAAEELPATRRAKQARLTRLWNETPWLFCLSAPLLKEVALETQIPSPLPRVEALYGGRAAGPSGWLPRDPPERSRTPKIQHLRAGAYEALRQWELGSPTAAAAFIDGDPDAKAPMSSSRCVKENEAWRKGLAEGLVESVLVPLPIDAVYEDEPNFEVWTARWMSDGRAHRALWFAFGRSERWFRWARVDGPENLSRRAAGGLRIFAALAPGLVLEPNRPGDYAGWTVRWTVAAPANDATRNALAETAAEPSHGGVRTSGVTTECDKTK